jgi:hypothetical protein
VPPMEHCACAMRDFIFCSFSSSSLTFSLRVTPCNSGLSLVGPALPFQPRLQGGPDLISSSNSKDDDVLPGKRWTGCNAGSNAVCSSYSCCVLQSPLRLILIPPCDPCKPSCQPGGDKDLVAPACEDTVREMLLYKRTVVSLYSAGVPQNHHDHAEPCLYSSLSQFG